MSIRLFVTAFALALTAWVAIPTSASAQVVVVNPPGPGRVVVRGNRGRVRTTVINPPGPGRVVVHDRPGTRRDTVVVNPPGPGRVVVRHGRH
jgi:hypothetical protein